MADQVRENRLMAMRLWGPLAPFVLALAALVFGIDQTHKWWMLSVLDIETVQPLRLTPFFDLILTWNQGISYGLFSSHQQGFLIALGLIVTALLWIWACRAETALTAYALAIIIGGALSNALDRAVHGAVADFFHFHLGHFSWYVFNLADVAIVAGVGMLLYESLFDQRRRGRRGNA